jgi:hypothetical protein
MKQKWYKKNTKYQSSDSSLTKEEQPWLLKVKALKQDRGVDFYGLLDEYEKMYKRSKYLQPSDELSHIVLRNN